MSLAKKLLKNSKLGETSILKESDFLKGLDETNMPVKAMNIAFSGRIDRGFKSGLTIFAGKSKHFKSNFSLVMVKAFLDKYDDGVCLFYDSEFGTMPEYFENFGVDPERVVHVPIEDIEELKFDITYQLSQLEKTDNVIIFVDSVGNLASKKEIEDAIDEKSVADMTRAKQLKSLFRIVTPMLTKRDVPMVVVAHTYDTMETYSKAVVSGGTGLYYSAQNIFIVGRRQNKTGKEVEGYDFILNVDKSRTIKEKSAIPITVSFDGGIDIYSGLLDIALALGFVEKPKNGWFTRPGIDEEKNWRRNATNTEEFWNPLLNSVEFQDAVESHFSLKGKKMFTNEMIAIDEESGEITFADEE